MVGFTGPWQCFVWDWLVTMGPMGPLDVSTKSPSCAARWRGCSSRSRGSTVVVSLRIRPSSIITSTVRRSRRRPWRWTKGLATWSASGEQDSLWNASSEPRGVEMGEGSGLGSMVGLKREGRCWHQELGILSPKSGTQSPINWWFSW